MPGLLSYFEEDLLCRDCLVTDSLTLIRFIFAILSEDASEGLTWPARILSQVRTRGTDASGSVAGWNDLRLSSVSMS